MCVGMFVLKHNKTARSILVVTITGAAQDDDDDDDEFE